MADRDRFELVLADALRAYAEEAPTDVNPTELVRKLAEAHSRKVWANPWPRALTSIAWLLLLGALLAALWGAVLFIGSHRPVLRNVSLVPTGIDVLTAETAEYGRMVVDGKGVLWAREAGARLVQFDPATASGRSWTISDDAAFTMSEIAPARAGGVWLATGQTLRRFDGAAFREVIEAPSAIAVLTEAPDESLWAATSEGLVLHWNGSSWDRLDPGRPSLTAWITSMTVDTAGRVWIGWTQGAPPPALGLVSRYDGSGWTRFEGRHAAALGGGIWSIVQLPDGSVWVASETGLARLDETEWTDQTPPAAPGAAISSVSTASDGAIWVTSGDPNSASISVGRLAGGSWTWYGPSDGLPLDAGCYTAWGASTEHGMFVGTCDGIYGLSNGHWERAWPPASSGPAWLGVRLALSRDELWATGDSGLWHLLDGSWTYEEVVPSPADAPTVLTRAPDGTLWAGGSDGVAYRRDGRWILADPVAASAIAVDAGGTVWVAGTDTWRTTRLNTGPELWTLRFDGTAWVKRTVEGCPLESLGMPVRSLAFDASGALWVGIPMGYETGGLARFDGHAWETIAQIGGSATEGATVLGTDPAGDMWVAAQYRYLRPDGASSVTFRAARFDGTRWTTFEMPEGGEWVLPVLAPDGTVWAQTTRGPARHDGQRWTYPYALAFPWKGDVAVAQDGSVFVSHGSSVLRLPATD